MAIVIVKNNTGNQVDIEDLGVSLTSTEIRNLTDFFDFVDLTESESLKTLVANATFTINDGVNDLSVAKGLEHLEIESIHLDYIQDTEDYVTKDTLPVTGAINLTTFTLTTTFTNIIYESQEFTNYTDKLEWNSGTPDRILIKEDGLYNVNVTNLVRVNTPTTASSFCRITKNGVPISSETYITSYNTDVSEMSLNYSIPCSAGDYITSQVRTDIVTNNIDITNTRINIIKLDGIQGDAGPAGGSTIEVQNGGVPITTNTSILNFQGAGVNVSSGGTGNAVITVSNTAWTTKLVQLYNTTGNQQVNTLVGTPITWTNQTLRDTDTFTWSAATTPSRCYVLASGWFVLTFSVNFIGDNGVKTIACYVRVNGTTILPITRCYSNSFRNGDPYGSVHTSVLIPLVSGDYIEILTEQAGSNGVAYTLPNETRFSLRYERGA